MDRELILVVDDEADILELISYNLKREGYAVHTATTGEQALASAASMKPDAIILDLMLPGMDGFSVCTRLKDQPHTRAIPVIMLTARGEDSDVVTGLGAGADDYITKPFSPKVLTARLRAVLRRSGEPAPPSTRGELSAHGIALDLSRHEARVEGELIHLSATEFAILEFLLRNPGWVFSRAKIIDAVHGKDYPVTERSVDVQILGLRKKLGAHGPLIETVRGIGYRIQPVGR